MQQAAQNLSESLNKKPDQFTEPVRDELQEHIEGISDEAMGMIAGLRKLGWNILYPLVPLIGLVFLVWHALHQHV